MKTFSDLLKEETMKKYNYVVDSDINVNRSSQKEKDAAKEQRRQIRERLQEAFEGGFVYLSNTTVLISLNANSKKASAQEILD